MNDYRDLTDSDWQRVSTLVPQLLPGPDTRRGRPLKDTRAVLNGVLWVLSNGQNWSSLPANYPPYQTCHRRFQKWSETGVLDAVLEALYGKAGLLLRDRVKQRKRASLPWPGKKTATWIIPMTAR